LCYINRNRDRILLNDPRRRYHERFRLNSGNKNVKTNVQADFRFHVGRRTVPLASGCNFSALSRPFPARARGAHAIRFHRELREDETKFLSRDTADVSISRDLSRKGGRNIRHLARARAFNLLRKSLRVHAVVQSSREIATTTKVLQRNVQHVVAARWKDSFLSGHE